MGPVRIWWNFRNENVKSVINRFLTRCQHAFEVPKEGRKLLSGCFIEIDDFNGAAKDSSKKIENIVIKDGLVHFGNDFILM